ncbi:MFS transporter [Paenibacillus sp. LMG 31456]|uniref:MFS transporter n=1 Tax=Paenibacillus foliorum TaxID=2654974 RepID=A0A972GWK6_9BACL|nr:MFS transporter [Paenibacillus foliorum]NOU97962.1 MFS transporter [Paenibacillus foliorum]
MDLNSAIQQNTANYKVLRGFSFSFYSTMAVITSYFPLYFQSKGFSAVQIGLLYSIGPMISIFSNLFWGFMSDKFHTVKKILIGILACQLIMAFFVSQSFHFGILMMLMAVFFFFQSPTSSLTDSLTLLTIRGTKKSYASFRLWGSIGFAVASLVFGMWLKENGPNYTLLLCLGTISISLILSLFLTDVRSTSFNKPEFRVLAKIIGSKRFLWFLLSVMIVSIAHRFNDGFLGLFLHQLGADPSLVGWAWLVSASSEIPAFILLSKYGHRFKELPLLVVCSTVYVIRFILMSLIDNPLLVIAVQALHSISFGIFMFTVIRYIQRIVPDEYRATGQAIYAVTWSGMAGLLSGVLGGWIFNLAGPHVMYGVGAILAFVGMISFLLLHLLQREFEE